MTEVFKDNEFRIGATKKQRADVFIIYEKQLNEFNEEYWKKVQTITEDSTLYFLINNLLERKLNK